ncbi:hypothetical protein ID866_8226 [Astraeus odoratus]|nr:hypothetical protein ID866_8226 [Astraeus odoratus]
MSSTLRGIISQGKGKAKTQLGNPILVKTIPVMERVEAVGLIQCDPNTSLVGLNQHLFTAGERGIIKIWDWKEGVLLRSLGAGLEPEQEEQRQILDAMYLPSVDTILSVHADQNIFFHSAKSGSLTRQVIGFNDEIVDAVFLSSPTGPSTSDCNTSDTHVALATNSSLIRVYSASSLDAHLLSGHSDVVLSLDRSAGGHLLASGSKDNSARIWAPSNSSADRVQWGCIAVCEGHAGSVGATVLSRIQSDNDARPQFMLTGSQDRTIKMWDLRDVSLIWNDDGKLLKCRSLVTHKAHEKDINSLDLAPTDQLLASGSQDRTANVYEISYRSACGGRSSHGEIRLLGTCKGHKRGVWNVKFGKTERVLATGSGDKTVKLWNLDDFTCVKTFEGHANSVLRVDFINNGTQLVSSGSDGLVKLWNTRDEECTATLDNHEDKSTATQSPSTTNTSVTGHPAVDEVLRSLSNPDLALLLRYVRDWNSNARTSGVAQSVLYAIVKLRHVEDVIAAFGDELSQAVSSADDLPKQAGGRTALKELVDGLIPYTQRHLSRLERLIQESFVLDYILNEMDGDIFEGEDHAMVDD